MKKKIIRIIILSTFLLSLFTIHVQATSTVGSDVSELHSIIADFFNKVFDVKPTDGSSFLESNMDKSERERINDDIFDGNSMERVSLYDRFGGTIKFIPYFGEIRIKTTLLDKFYSVIIELDEENFALTVDDIIMFFSQQAISNNTAYETRPPVLGQDEVEGGYVDPRVYTYSAVSSTGGAASMGNVGLSVGKCMTAITGYFSSGGLFRTLEDIWRKFCDAGGAEFLTNLAKFFLPIMTIWFLLRMIPNGFKVLKGDFALKKFLEDLLSVCISLGLIFTLSADPNAFGSTLSTISTFIDDTFDKALALSDDEVFASDRTENIRTAFLWKETVLEPWCTGMWDLPYESLYTQYDTNPSHTKMEQSNDDVDTTFYGDEVRYNSTKLTGDIVVPLDNGREIRNWAALAWSCQSVYHIDAVEASYERMIPNAWPKAEVTPRNTDIFVDNFRWLDAMLDISPEYREENTARMNYANSKDYKQWFIKGGAKSVYLSGMLIPILIIAFRKTYSIVLLLVSAIRLLLLSLWNLGMSNSNVLNNLKKTFKPLADYFWWSIMSFVAITSYGALMNKNIFCDMVWVILGVILNLYKPISMTHSQREALEITKRELQKLGRVAVKMGRKGYGRVKSALGKK